MKNNIKERRKFFNEKYPKVRMTQGRLANLVGVDQSTIAKIEKCERMPTLELAFKIARILRCKVDDLFKFESKDRRSLNNRRNNFERSGQAEPKFFDYDFELEKLASIGRDFLGLL